MEAIDVAGARILSIMVSVAYWVIIVAGTGQIIRCVTKKDMEGVLKNAFLYGVAFASIFLLRWTLDLVREVFS